MILSVDGLMGSGKSTLLRRLRERGYDVILEPVEDWEFLPKFYENPKKYALAFQVEVLLSFSKYDIPKDKIVIVERCPQVSRMVFAQMLVSSGTLTNEDMATLSDLYQKVRVWEPDSHIFLDCPVDVCKSRVDLRDSHASKITTSYMMDLKKHYDVFLRYTNSVTIDSNRCIDDVEKDVVSILDALSSHPEKTP
jgi:deoxyadenosine/deoxycytidine kinase